MWKVLPQIAITGSSISLFLVTFYKIEQPLHPFPEIQSEPPPFPRYLWLVKCSILVVRNLKCIFPKCLLLYRLSSGQHFYFYKKNRPFLSSLLPLFQSKSKCETILMKMTLICMKMNLRAGLIFIWKVSHLDSFWNRGPRELGNGLFLKLGLTKDQ